MGELGKLLPAERAREAPADVVVVETDVAAGRRFNWKEHLAPWLVSLCVNGTMTSLLALVVVVPMLKGLDSLEPVTAQLMEDRLEEIERALDTTAEFEAASDLPREQAAPSFQGFETTGVSSAVAIDTTAPSAASDAPASSSSALPPLKPLEKPIVRRTPPALPSPKELTQAAEVGAAVDRLGEDINGLLTEGDLTVVWLLDASLSLVDDRRRASQRLEGIYQKKERELIELKRAAKTSQERAAVPILRNAVVAFGGGMIEVVPPTVKSDRAVRAIADIPIDQTGLENVFSAIQSCVIKYSARPVGGRKSQLLLVVFTDESGDDILKLEPTIALCQEHKVRVEIIGPTAVSGAEMGTHGYIEPTLNRLLFLPVKKGPDTAFAERLLWPFWWGGATVKGPPPEDDPEAAGEPVQIGMSQGGWEGGYDLYHIASGLPPYALMRLSRETGGTYTLFDRLFDRGPFTLDQMRPYAADYRAAAEIHAEIHYFPLRRAIMESVEISRVPLNWPAQLPDNVVDYRVRLEGGLTLPPMIYANSEMIRANFRNAAQKSAESLIRLERAMKPFGPEGMEPLYASEPSPRWRAWYDLNYGRLLAQHVRHCEVIALANLALAPRVIPEGATVNSLHVEPLPRLLSGSVSERRAAEAERLLRRCVEKNPNTPWWYLAQRELAHPLGIGYRLFYTPPVAIPAAPAGMPGKISLPRL